MNRDEILLEIALWAQRGAPKTRHKAPNEDELRAVVEEILGQKSETEEILREIKECEKRRQRRQRY